MDLPPGTWVDLQATTSSGAGPRLLPGSPDTPIRILPDSPGILEWRSRDPKRNEWIAVNLPTVESDLRSLPEAVLREQISSTLVSGRQARHLREGVECWHWLLGLAVVWALLEGAALAFWEGRR